jgi:hypothetical protein
LLSEIKNLKEYIMTKNLPACIDKTPQRWIVSIVDGKIQFVNRIGPCAIVITPEEIPRLILMKGWVGDELTDQIRSALIKRENNNL